MIIFVINGAIQHHWMDLHLTLWLWSMISMGMQTINELSTLMFAFSLVWNNLLVNMSFFQACEQLNAWLGGFQPIHNRITVYNFKWFIHTMLFLHTQWVIKRQPGQNGRWGGWGRCQHWRGGIIYTITYWYTGSQCCLLHFYKTDSTLTPWTPSKFCGFYRIYVDFKEFRRSPYGFHGVPIESRKIPCGLHEDCMWTV